MDFEELNFEKDVRLFVCILFLRLELYVKNSPS